MRLVVLDYETEFGDDYTLKKMSTEAYIRDPRFRAHGASIKWSANHAATWYDEKELRHVLADEDWSDVFLVCHHAHFDGLILSHHYGVKPAMWGCTLSMARQLLGNHVSASLDSVRAHFGIPAKRTPYERFKNKTWEQLDHATRVTLAEGCNDEAESIWKIFHWFAQEFPAEEYEVVDSTIRWFTEPCLKADTAILGRVWQAEVERKRNLLARLGVQETELASADRFADLLRARGVEPQMKLGKEAEDGTPRYVYAFAKTDAFMEELLLDEDEEVQALAEARLGIKSTLLQSRAETLGWMASRGAMCVYLSYCAAHTSRWGGGDKSNWQNFPRSSDINNAIIAPDGFLLAAPDASQIECRLLNMLAGQHDKIDEFRENRDPYVAVASAFYGYEVNKKDHPEQRQVGKVLELQCGFGSGGPKIQHTLRTQAKINLDADEGMRARDAYRNTHPAVVQLWKDAELNIKRMSNWLSFDWGPLRVQCDVDRGRRRIVLPNGVQIIYDTLEWFVDEERQDAYWRLKTRKGWVKLYGAKLVENVIQALARVVVSQAMIRLKRLGYRTVSMKHDELWVLVPRDGREKEHEQILIAEMSREPVWFPGIPLAAESKMGERYAK